MLNFHKIIQTQILMFIRQLINQLQFVCAFLIKVLKSEFSSLKFQFMKEESNIQRLGTEIWSESIEEMNKNSQQFARFYHDDVQSEHNHFKREIHQENAHVSEQSFEASLKYLLKTFNDPLSNQTKILLCEQEIMHLEKAEQSTEEDQQLKRDKKSGVYSKNYRQKKKEKMKFLQEQNIFLKKKIDDLQLRLRQKQMELNRMKFSSHEEFDIQQINEEIMKKLKLISQSDPSPPKQSQLRSKYQKQCIPKEKKMAQFLNFFQIHGLGGKKTKELLQYYVNQFLQNVMRDRQKYYALKCIKNSNSNKNQKVISVLDLAVQGAFEQTEEERKNQSKFGQYLTPIVLELVNTCREFYRSSQKVIKMLDTMHQKSRIQLSQDVQTIRKRMKMVMWFQINQYRKDMRQLRAEWMDLMRVQQDQQGVLQVMGKKRIMA